MVVGTFLSCNKGKNPQDSNQVNNFSWDKFQSTKINPTKENLKSILEKNAIENAKKINIESTQGITGGTNGGGGCCRYIANAYTYTLTTKREIINGTDVYLTYSIATLESPCPTSTLSYSFGLAHSSLISTNDLGFSPLGQVCLNPGFTNCYDLHFFTVTFLMSYTDYCTYNNLTLSINTSSACAGTINYTKSVPTELSYCQIPAVIGIFIDPFNSDVVVSTECACVCSICHTSCPTGGSFQYRIIGTSTWTTLSLSTSGGTISGLPSGNYEFESTLNYSACPSDILTGTFTL